MPALQEQFKQTQNFAQKAQIANAIVKLKDNDDTYWNYLAQRATVAVESDVPSPWVYNVHDTATSAQGLAKWAQAHRIDLPAAMENAQTWYPGSLMILSDTGDARAVPILEKGLLSANSLIELEAAMGLAFLHDESAVPLIVQAVQRAPKDLAPDLAESLVFFDDPVAQSTVDAWLGKDRAKALRQRRAAGENALGLPPSQMPPMVPKP